MVFWEGIWRCSIFGIVLEEGDWSRGSKGDMRLEILGVRWWWLVMMLSFFGLNNWKDKVVVKLGERRF